MMVKQAEFLIANENITDVEYDTHVDTGERTEQEAKTESFADAMRSNTNSFVTVQRQVYGGNAPMEHIGRFPSDKYDYGQMLDHLKMEYGGGEFRLMLFVKGKIKQNVLVNIAKPKSFDSKDHNKSDLEGLYSMVERQNHYISELAQRLAQQPVTPQPSRQEFLEELAMYQKIFGGDGGQKSSGLGAIKETLELFALLGVNIGNNSEEKETGFLDVITKALPLLGGAMNNRAQPVQHIHPQPQTPPQTHETQYKQNPIEDEHESNDDMFKQMMVKQGVAMLVTAAKNESDPAGHAEVVLNSIGEDTAKQYLLLDNSIELLCSINPEVENHQEWFKLLIEHIKAQIGLESSVSDMYDNDGETLKESV